MGRIEHKRVGGQTGADVERVDEIMKVCIMVRSVLLHWLMMHLYLVAASSTHSC